MVRISDERRDKEGTANGQRAAGSDTASVDATSAEPKLAVDCSQHLNHGATMSIETRRGATAPDSGRRIKGPDLLVYTNRKRNREIIC